MYRRSLFDEPDKTENKTFTVKKVSIQDTRSIIHAYIQTRKI